MLAESLVVFGSLFTSGELCRVGSTHSSCGAVSFVRQWWAMPTLQSSLLVAGEIDEDVATPIASLTFDWKMYQTPQTRRYSVARRDKEGTLGAVEGFLVSSTRIEGDQLVLLDEMMDKQDQGERKFRSIQERCVMESLLTPVSVDVTLFPTEGSPRVASAKIGEGKVSAKMPNGATRNYELRADSLTRSALLRVISQLPREVGRRFQVSNLFESDVNDYSDGPLTIECVDKEIIEAGGREVECHRFTLRDDDGGFDDQFWVDTDGVLRRIVSAGRDVFELVGTP